MSQSKPNEDELDEMLEKYTTSIENLTRYIFIENKLPETWDLPDGISLKSALRKYFLAQVLELAHKAERPEPVEGMRVTIYLDSLVESAERIWKI